MIARFLSFLILLYALGFILFGVTLGRPAKADVRTDAAVVVTGGTGRIEHAMKVLEQGKAKRVLIAGADPLVTKKDLVDRFGAKGRLVRCCVDLGSESVDTRSNAEEAQRWLVAAQVQVGAADHERLAHAARRLRIPKSARRQV